MIFFSKLPFHLFRSQICSKNLGQSKHTHFPPSGIQNNYFKVLFSCIGNTFLLFYLKSVFFFYFIYDFNELSPV